MCKYLTPAAEFAVEGRGWLKAELKQILSMHIENGK